MRIAYIAKHDSGGNDDEGAIAFVLRMLGHRVTIFTERELSRGLTPISRIRSNADLILCHSWPDIQMLAGMSIPKVFWYFDRVDEPIDPTLELRSERRRLWIKAATETCDLGYCTDGDWVARDVTHKLMWLPQGADNRLVGFHHEPVKRLEGLAPDAPTMICTAKRTGCGTLRQTFVDDLKHNWGSAVLHVDHGLHGQKLQDVMSHVLLAVAPVFPASDMYWSNRVYTASGFGTVVLHPYCEYLARQYQAGQEIIFYSPLKWMRYGMIDVIAEALSQHKRLMRMGLAAYERTVTEHTYSHRCQAMLADIKNRLGVS